MIYSIQSFLLLLATAIYLSSLEKVNAFTFGRTKFLNHALKPKTITPITITTSKYWLSLKNKNKNNIQLSSTHLHMSTQAEIDAENEQIMTEWLDDMIYSGDMAGYLKRNENDMLCDEFVDFLTQKSSTVDDDDEKAAIQEALIMVKAGMDMTDGLGGSSGEVFEKRLDGILFIPPNQRKAHLEDIVDDLTISFIEYVQKEMTDSDDTDTKVVIATILKLIGEVKSENVLGGASVLLSQADGSLGDEYAEKSQNDSNDPNSFQSQFQQEMGITNRNEQILASLMFSQNDIMEDILNNLHEIDGRFTQFLQEKVTNTRDLDERVGLKSLLETIQTVLQRVEEVEEEGPSNQSIDTTMDMDTIKARMQEVQMGATLSGKEMGKVSQMFTVQETKDQTFKKIISMFTERLMNGDTLEQAVEHHYDLCDYDFMQSLKVKADSPIDDEDPFDYNDLLNEITKTSAKKIGSAQEKLQQILQKGRPDFMEAEIITMARKGEVDEALVLLLEANAQQAEQAGATAPAEVLRKLIKKANEEREKKLPDEQRLLRALIKLDNSEERKGLLYTAFQPVKTLQDTEDGPKFVEGQPLITPPAFITAVRNLIKGFGNVEDFKIMDIAKDIIEEAQQVATDLYGEGMTARQQQDFMFKEKTVSVWDLANLEEKSLTSGEDVPWEGNPMYDDMSPEEVLGEIARNKKDDEPQDVTNW